MLHSFPWQWRTSQSTWHHWVQWICLLKSRWDTLWGRQEWKGIVSSTCPSSVQKRAMSELNGTGYCVGLQTCKKTDWRRHMAARWATGWLACYIQSWMRMNRWIAIRLWRQTYWWSFWHKYVKRHIQRSKNRLTGETGWCQTLRVIKSASAVAEQQRCVTHEAQRLTHKWGSEARPDELVETRKWQSSG